MFTYGTAGFRYDSNTIISIARKIGQACCVLSHLKKKPIGIMITASHNPYTDNGVKLVNYDGTMLSPTDESFMVNSINNHNTYNCSELNTTIVIGMDTRNTSNKIKELIITGIYDLDSSCIIVDIGMVTTPQLHHAIYKTSFPSTPSYQQAYFSQLKDLEYPHVVVDCANGVGSLTLQEIVNTNHLKSNIILHHNNTFDYTQLNHKCGSDFVVSHGNSDFCKMDHVLHASLDGDADRIVCYYAVNGMFRLLDGDYISALFAYYFYKRVNTTGLRVGVVHTAYANSQFLWFIDSLGFDTCCTATGVKHLHRAAQEYDIGIYFESNGHGSVVLKESHIDPDLSAFLNPLIGDGIADLFAISYVLQELDISPKQWYELFHKIPARTYKLVVKDKSIFRTTPDESRLIEPPQLQQQLDDIMKNGYRIFLRPSGTENILRMHIEAATETDMEEAKHMVRDSLKQYI